MKVHNQVHPQQEQLQIMITIMMMMMMIRIGIRIRLNETNKDSSHDMFVSPIVKTILVNIGDNNGNDNHDNRKADKQ